MSRERVVSETDRQVQEAAKLTCCRRGCESGLPGELIPIVEVYDLDLRRVSVILEPVPFCSQCAQRMDDFGGVEMAFQRKSFEIAAAGFKLLGYQPSYEHTKLKWAYLEKLRGTMFEPVVKHAEFKAEIRKSAEEFIAERDTDPPQWRIWRLGRLVLTASPGKAGWDSGLCHMGADVPHTYLVAQNPWFGLGWRVCDCK